MSLDNQEKTPTEWSTYPDQPKAADQAVRDHDVHQSPEGAEKHSGHRWMMVLMCLPLVGIGIWQWASGAGIAPLLGGLACFAMMAVMHLGMGSSHRH